MENFMIKILIFIILSIFIFANNNYYLQLAVCNNIKDLKQFLIKVPYSLSQNIKVVKYNKFYIIFTINRQSYFSIKQDIILYKVYFKNAIISNSNIIERYQFIDLNKVINSQINNINQRAKIYDIIKNKYYI